MLCLLFLLELAKCYQKNKSQKNAVSSFVLQSIYQLNQFQQQNLLLAYRGWGRGWLGACMSGSCAWLRGICGQGVRVCIAGGGL